MNKGNDQAQDPLISCVGAAWHGSGHGGGFYAMSDLVLLSERQMSRISTFFPLSHGVPRVDDRRVISGIIYVIKHGLQWKDAPKAYGPHKTLYNRFVIQSLRALELVRP